DLVALDDDRRRTAPADEIRDGGADRAAAADHDTPAQAHGACLCRAYRRAVNRAPAASTRIAASPGKRCACDEAPWDSCAAIGRRTRAASLDAAGVCAKPRPSQAAGA